MNNIKNTTIILLCIVISLIYCWEQNSISFTLKYLLSKDNEKLKQNLVDKNDGNEALY